ncbi:sialate O-acetylesterase [Opitutus terrae]|nr:sialate O-acetylesterase [Opitutus terrae]
MKSGILFAAFRRSLFAFFACGVLASGVLRAADQAPLPFVSPIFGDAMVLQRGKPNTLWGWTKPGAEVRVTVGDHTARSVAQQDGRWSVAIEPPPVGGPYTIVIDGPQRVELRDVLVGDVWLCGGQSNMEMALVDARNGNDEVKAADHPQIRFFIVRPQIAYAPASTVQGSWKVCSPETAAQRWGGLSAVGYFFARRLRQDVDVPIGLVQDAVGGTPAESWTSAEALRPLKDFDQNLDELARLRANHAPEYGNFVTHWYDEYDPGQKDNAWAQPGFDETDWKPVTVPGGFRELGVPETPAVVYFRRTIELPDPLPAGMAMIRLGVVERMDTAFINGRQVGASSWVENPRVYRIPEGTLKPGPNQITIRVLKTKPDGGFMSKPEDLKLVLGDKTEIPLAGAWKAKLAVDARPPHPLPVGYENWPVMPAVLYNGMIAPIAPLALTGALWYQGEANASHAQQYRTLLPAMIADWRRSFGQGDFPFYIVSLAAFMQHKDTPPETDGWAELRGAQDFVAHSVPNSGLAVAIDVGNADNIHPVDKKEVGERLALIALAKHYGKKVPYSGPRLASVERLPNALRLTFTHTDGGLIVKGEQPEEFALCGEDRVWHRAHGKIVDDTVVVSSSEVLNPVAVRYAWQSNPKATLFNGAGLPAIPFETEVGR